MIKDYKQKVKATILLLFSILIFGFLLEDLNWIWSLHEGGYYNITTSYSLALLKISRFVHQHSMSIYIAFILLVVFSILLVWRWNYLDKKFINSITTILNTLYILLFLITIILYFYNFIQGLNKSVANIGLIHFFILFSLIESIWKFNKKSTLRKYFNSLYFIFFSFVWVSMLVVDSDVWGISFFNILIALSAYLISLIIAAAEFTRRSKSMPESNSVLPKQAIEQ